MPTEWNGIDMSAKNGLNFNYVWQPASEEKPAEDVQTAPQAEVAPVSWFGNGPTHADLGCDDLFCRVRGGDIPLVEFLLLFLLGFVVGSLYQLVAINLSLSIHFSLSTSLYIGEIKTQEHI